MACTGIKQFFLFCAIVLINYVSGRIIHAGKGPWRKAAVVFFIVFDVLYLGYFKYTNFLIDIVNYVFHNDLIHYSIFLPIGISFYSFQEIAYLVDSYRGETEGYSLRDYLMFISFFPQLIVGPIVHHKEIIPQLREEAHIDFRNAYSGLFLILLGAIKKTLVADPLTNLAVDMFASPLTASSGALWLGTLSYTVSYYFDLSSYADMAIGLALLFNIKLPYNFHYPFRAWNMADFWRRWHITLSRFLNDYIFRSVYRKGNKCRNYYFAVMVTFLVSGIWHGAGFNFILWGVLNGVLVCIGSYIEHKEINVNKKIGWLVTIACVALLRVLFVNTISDSLVIYKKLFDISPSPFSGIHTFGLRVAIGWALAFFFLIFKLEAPEVMEKMKPTVLNTLIGVFMAIIVALSMGYTKTFLYFQF